MPRAIAFGKRADQQRLQLGPGFLRVEEVGTGGVQALFAFAEGQGAHSQLAVGFDPAAVGWQDHLLGNGGTRHSLRVLRRAGAQYDGGKAGE
ncbi:hypothetical protein D3C75_1148270 [compost metagenome]